MSIRKEGVRVGYLYGFSDDPVVAALEFNEKGCLVQIPSERIDVKEALSDGMSGIPDEMVFKDSYGALWLASSRIARTRFDLRGEGQCNIQVDRIVESDFSESSFKVIVGMKTIIDGLYQWSGVEYPVVSIDCSDVSGQAVEIRVKNIPSIELQGPMGSKLSTSIIPLLRRFTGWIGLDYRVHFQTSSAELRPWDDHARFHGMMQDMMCLVYGKPCAVKIVNVSNDIKSSVKGAEVERRWAEVHEPEFGYVSRHVERMNPARDHPLFKYDDMDPKLFSDFMRAWDSWSKPLRIATTTLFQAGATVEAELIQIAVALESLGFEIQRRRGVNHAKNPEFEALVKEIVNDFISKDDEVDRRFRSELLCKILQGAKPSGKGMKNSDWVKCFKDAYLGAKHADRELPDPYASYVFARQGFELIRVWFGKKVGVDGRLLAKNLNLD